MSSANLQKRYPGVKPFATTEQELFFGRDRDIEDLWNLLWLSKLVVLFGKSGYGKSSLINAGILPEISKEEATVPIVVRLGVYLEGQTPAPLENLRLKTNELLTDNPDAAFLDELNLPPTLWQQVKRKQSPQQRRFIFIFDQFEEFFSYPPADQQAFKEQLAELLYTEVPQSIRNLHGSFELNQQDFIANPFEAKVLLAIRSDRLSLLDSMKDKLPAILQKRYELKGLSEAQAREAIHTPALRKGQFASAPFTYSDEAMRVMTQKLSDTQDSRNAGIEAFQLQILCEYLEDKIIQGVIPNNHIEPQHFAFKINEVFEGYYQRLISRLDVNDQSAARLLIEEKMILEDEVSGEVRRLSVDSGIMKSVPGITQLLLDQLENTFLLRREATSIGGINYEVSHDTLIAPILKSKLARREKERTLKEQLAAQRKRKKLLVILFVITMVLAIAIGLMIFVLKLRNEAVKSRDEAEEARNLAIIERDKAKKALEDKEIAEFQDVYQRANNILNSSGRNCPSNDMLKSIDDMRGKYPDNESLQNQIKSIDVKLKAKNCRGK